MNDNVKPSRDRPFLFLPICVVSCPHCSVEYSQSCDNLNTLIACPGCGRQFIYIDAFLNHYRRMPGIFVDPVHAIPIAPGYTLGGEIKIIPDELQVTSYGIRYNRPPELFFLDGENRPVRDVILNNLYVAAVSISEESFILLSRTLKRGRITPEQSVRWLSIGEIGDREKPIWISILQNSADLLLKSEERAALVMLQIAFDFFLDAVIAQIGLRRTDVKAATRRWKISDRRAKIRLLEQRFGSFPKAMINDLINLAEQRNRIVHGTVEKPLVRTFSGVEAFQTIIEAIITINDLKYACFLRENRVPNVSDDFRDHRTNVGDGVNSVEFYSA